MNKSSIDYLIIALKNEYGWFPNTQSEIIIKAKEMHEKEIKNAVDFGCEQEANLSDDCLRYSSKSLSSNYYKYKFKKII